MILRHHNRRPPAAKIVCKPDAVRWNDSDTFALGQMLGYVEGAQA